MARAEFPFLYYQHGALHLDTISKAGGAYIAFRSPVPTARRKEVQKGCPSPIDGLWTWGKTIAGCESAGDIFDWEIAETYADGDLDNLNEAHVAAFAADVERWIRGVHAKFPILFFLGPAWAKESAWGKYSAAALPAVMIPFLEDYAKAHAAVVAKDSAKQGVFDKTSMSVILQHVPADIADAKLASRAKALVKRFPL